MRWLLLSVAAIAAPAHAADPAIAVALEGDVLVVASEAPSRPLAPFATVHVGETVQIGEGGSLQLLFSGNGRRESWTGPITVKIGDGRGEGKGTPAVVELGPEVGGAMGDLQILLTRAERQRSGTTLFRGDVETPLALTVDEQQELEAARATHARLSASRTGPSDILPELALGAVLLRLEQYAEACEVLHRAEAACPECPPPGKLLDMVGRQACR